MVLEMIFDINPISGNIPGIGNLSQRQINAGAKRLWDLAYMPGRTRTPWERVNELTKIQLRNEVREVWIAMESAR